MKVEHVVPILNVSFLRPDGQGGRGRGANTTSFGSGADQQGDGHVFRISRGIG